MKWTTFFVGVTGLLTTAMACAAQTCQPTWSDEFASGDMAGSIEDLCAFDDGSGPKLYAAGNLDLYVNNNKKNWPLASWDGLSWKPVAPTTKFESPVDAIAVHDDGSGLSLYVGGYSLMQFPGSGQYVALVRWDGDSWSRVGEHEFYQVDSIIEFDDGTGLSLFVASAYPDRGVWKWDGHTWQQLGGNFGYSDDTTLAVCDLGQGPRLFVGGSFKNIDGVEVNGIAMWDGTAWVPLDSGLRRSQSNSGRVYAIASHDDGTGPALFVGGDFREAGSVEAQSIAKWDGSAWSSIGDANSSVYTLRSVEFAGKKSLVAGGRFTTIGGVSASGIAQRIGSNWSTMDGGFAGSPRVYSTAIYDFGNGPELAVGGTQFQATSHTGALGGVASWNGSQWNRLHEGDGMQRNVVSIIQSDVSGEQSIYAAGSFLTAGPEYVGYVARRDANGWHALAGGVDGPVHQIIEHNNQSGKSVVVAGSFDRAFNSPNPHVVVPPVEIAANAVAMWDGNEWSAMGTGIGEGNPTVTAVASFDDGSGPAVYLSYTEDISSTRVHRIMRWDGVRWTQMSVGLNASVDRFVIHDDGGGEHLYAAGDELTPTHAVFRLEGGKWTKVGDQIKGTVRGMNAVDDGISGPMLYVSGSFQLIQSGPTVYAARWNGVEWEGTSMSTEIVAAVRKMPGGDALYTHSGNIIHEVTASGKRKFMAWGGDNLASDMLVVEEQGEPVMYLGGSFDHVDGIPSRRFARIELCDPCYADCHIATGVGVLDILDFLCFQDSFVNGQAYACDCDKSSGMGVCDVFDFLCFQDAYIQGCP